MSRAGWSGGDLDARLTPFLGVTGRSTRSKWAPLYVRGLLSSDGPKSVQPIAIRLGLPSHDQLHHFVSSAAWNDGPLWRVLAEKADSLLGGDDAVLVVDDTALPKKGPASVGVTGQYSQAAEPPANPARLMVFFDETWTTTNMARLRGRSPRGTRLLAAVPHGQWHTSTFLAGLRIDRMVALLVLDGAINGDAFPVYVQQFLAPSLTVGDIVIADNLASHKVAGIREVGCLECSAPSRSGSDREDLRHVEAQLRATSNAMARSRSRRRSSAFHRHRLQPQAQSQHPPRVASRMIEGSKNDWRTPGRLTEQFASKFNVPNSSAHRSPNGCV